MNARILATAALAAAFTGVLPARAADPQMLSLVMPDAKILSGINVQQAMTTPFGQFVLAQIAPQDQEIVKFAALLGFDPRSGVTELLAASDGTTGGAALTLARGAFDPAKIAAAALLAGGKSETYAGVTILETADQKAGIAFTDPSLAIVGSTASVKAAIDRLKTPATLPQTLTALVNQWSLSEDAWAVSILPPSAFKAPAGATQIPGLSQLANSQLIQQGAAGVKFGSTIIVTAQAQTDSAQNATTLAGAIQFLQNLVQAQASQDPQAAGVMKAISVSAQGSTVSFTMAVTEAQIEGLIQSKPSRSSSGATSRTAAPPPAKKII